MCGILLILGDLKRATTDEQRAACLAALRARGPEYAAIAEHFGALMGFTRLAINGLSARGNQPILVAGDEKRGGSALVCNGEIYNHAALAAALKTDSGVEVDAESGDCAVLPHLLATLPPTEACRAIDGVFALARVGAASGTTLVARDPYGVRPLYWGRSRGTDGVAFASEIKALLPICSHIEPFPPGKWWRVDTHSGLTLESGRYHETPWLKVPLFDDEVLAAGALSDALIKAVEKRLMSDRPVGALLSGGLDSSLVCAIAAHALSARGKRLTTFTVGMAGSTDLAYARKVATHIKSEHHEVLLTPADFFAAIPAVIAAAGTYDVTSVRATVGNYLVAKHIREHTDVKVVLNGDGSDEVGGGYLYFGRAPSDAAFEAECDRLLADIHYFDVLRSDRGVAAHGLEARTPFLDKQLVNTWRAISTRLRRHTAMQPEKSILRRAFAEEGLLPDEVLWRTKEAFSDGVSAVETPWHASIDAWARSFLTERGVILGTHFAHNTPRTRSAQGASA